MRDNTNFAGISVKDINLTNREEYIRRARAKFNAYSSKWEKSYFDDNTGGYIVTDKYRIAQSYISKNETEKFYKEYGMCMTLAKNGHSVEYLIDKKSSYDIHLNSIKADLKKTGSHNNIVNYAKEAIREQGAEIVVFEFENNSKEIHTQLLKLSKMYGIHGYFYFSDNKGKIYKF